MIVGEYLEDMSSETDQVERISRRLRSLSMAFYTTGNEILGGELDEMAIALNSAQKNINHAVSKEIGRNLDDAQQSAANTVMACLAVNRTKD